MSFKETVFSLLIFFVSIILLLVSWSKISNCTISSLLEKDLGSKSSVSVSPIKLNWLSKKITLSKFWNKNLVENKNFLISSSSNLIFNLTICSIVFSMTWICLLFLFFIKLGFTFPIYI